MNTDFRSFLTNNISARQLMISLIELKDHALGEMQSANRNNYKVLFYLVSDSSNALSSCFGMLKHFTRLKAFLFCFYFFVGLFACLLVFVSVLVFNLFFPFFFLLIFVCVFAHFLFVCRFVSFCFCNNFSEFLFFYLPIYLFIYSFIFLLAQRRRV